MVQKSETDETVRVALNLSCLEKGILLISLFYENI